MTVGSLSPALSGSKPKKLLDQTRDVLRLSITADRLNDRIAIGSNAATTYRSSPIGTDQSDPIAAIDLQRYVVKERPARPSRRRWCNRHSEIVMTRNVIPAPATGRRLSHCRERVQLPIYRSHLGAYNRKCVNL